MRLPPAAFRVERRDAPAEVLLVLARFAFPRLAAGFLVTLLRVPAAALFAAEERLDLPVLLAAPLDLAFFRVEPLFPLRGLRSPVKTSTNEVTALRATSTAAFTFACAASLMASCAVGVSLPPFLSSSCSFFIVSSFQGLREHALMCTGSRSTARSTRGRSAAFGLCACSVRLGLSFCSRCGSFTPLI